MEHYKLFIKEVTSLHIKIVKLLTHSNEIFLNVDDLTIDELSDVLKDRSWSVKEYWDLSHYSMSGEKHFGDNYQHKLSEMAKLALINILSLNTGKEMLRTIDQFLVPFKRFHTNYYNEDMNQYIYVIPPDFGMNITYNQCDLRQNFLNCFDITGIPNDNDGYCPDFIQQLHDIFVKKRGVLELLKTNLSGASEISLKRKNPFSNEITQFSFDSLSGNWITMQGINEPAGREANNVKCLEDLFIYKPSFKKAIKALQNVKVIGADNSNLIGTKLKGVMQVWIYILKNDRRLLCSVSDKDLTVLLNQHFTNLNISEKSDGKHFRNPVNKTASNLYRAKLLALI